MNRWNPRGMESRRRAAVPLAVGVLALLMLLACAAEALAQGRCPPGTLWRAGRCRWVDPQAYAPEELRRRQVCLEPYNYCTTTCRQEYYTHVSPSAFRACMDRCQHRYERCLAP